MTKKYIDADRLKQTIADNVYPVQDAFNSRDYGMFWTGGIEKAIDEAPAADIAPRWIPVTERLPELNRDVLLSVRQGYAFGEPDNWCVVGGLIDKEDITWATNYGFHDLLYSNGKKHTVWVSAWMPLPEPYKGGEKE